MEHRRIAGIDVSKDRLDVHVLPSQEAFAVSRDPTGLAELCRRLGDTATLVAVEATGGYETLVAATLADHGVPVVVVNWRRSGPLPRRWGNGPRPIRSMRRSSPASPRPRGPRSGRCQMRQPACLPI